MFRGTEKLIDVLREASAKWAIAHLLGLTPAGSHLGGFSAGFGNVTEEEAAVMQRELHEVLKNGAPGVCKPLGCPFDIVVRPDVVPERAARGRLFLEVSVWPGGRPPEGAKVQSIGGSTGRGIVKDAAREAAQQKGGDGADVHPKQP